MTRSDRILTVLTVIAALGILGAAVMAFGWRRKRSVPRSNR